MATSERTLKLVFTGQDDSGRAVKSVTESMKGLKQAFREGKADLTAEKQAYSDSITVLKGRQRQERLLNLEYRESHQNLFRVAGVINSVGNAALTVNSVLTNYNMLQTRIKQQNNDVASAYDKMQEAITRFGVGSSQAQDAIKAFNEEQEKAKDLAADANLQYVNMALSFGSMASDATRIAQQFNTIRQAGKTTEGSVTNTVANAAGAAGVIGAGNKVKNVLTGVGTKAGLVTSAGTGALASAGGSKLTTLGKVAGAAGGGLLVTSGILTSQALSEDKLSNEDRIFSVLQQAGGGALLGATLGTVVPGIGNLAGAAIGGGAGFVSGLATNFGEEFGNLFAGKGFLSNEDAAKAQNNTYNVNIYTNQIANANDLKAQLEAEARVYGNK